MLHTGMSNMELHPDNDLHDAYSITASEIENIKKFIYTFWFNNQMIKLISSI